jgi:hypothetical protein
MARSPVVKSFGGQMERDTLLIGRVIKTLRKFSYGLDPAAFSARTLTADRERAPFLP